MQELERIYQMFQHVLTEKVEDYSYTYKTDYKRFSSFYNPINGNSERAYRYFDAYDNEFNVSPRFFEYMLGLRGFTAFPKFLTNEAYDGLKKLPLYHGFKEFEHGASYLADWNYHFGITDNHGTYFSSSIIEAMTYLGNYGNSNPGDKKRVLEVKLTNDNFIDKKDLLTISSYVFDPYELNKVEDEDNIKDLNLSNEKLDMINNIIEFKQKHKDDRDFEKFMRHMYNPQILAVYLGYDYIKVFKYETLNVIVLNRNVVAVSENEFRKFVDNSKSYIGDSIIPENNI